MASSLETRVPFLDHKLIEYVNKIPHSLKFRNGQGKWILRQILSKYVPKNLTDRPKMGFSVPINSWLRTSLKDWTKDTLSSKNIKSYEILDPKRVENILQQHFSEKKNEYKTGYKSTVAKKSEVNKFLNFIIEGLDKKGFLQPNHKRKSMIRNISNIFHRANLSEQEIRILLGIFSTLNEFNRKS